MANGGCNQNFRHVAPTSKMRRFEDWDAEKADQQPGGSFRKGTTSGVRQRFYRQVCLVDCGGGDEGSEAAVRAGAAARCV